jgi:hypothetical protein
LPGKPPNDLRRTGIRNLERAGVPRSAAMAMVGHRSESVHRGIATADGTALNESSKIGRVLAVRRVLTCTLQVRLSHSLPFVHEK